MLEEEGLEASFARHEANHLRLVEGLSRLGLDMAVMSATQLSGVDSGEPVTPRSGDAYEVDLEVVAGLGSWRKALADWSHG